MLCTLMLGTPMIGLCLIVREAHCFICMFSQDTLKVKKSDWRTATLGRIALHNRRNCNHRPVYGFDLHDAVDVWTNGLHSRPFHFRSNSAVHCYNAARIVNPNHPRYYWSSTSYLKSAILSAAERLLQLKDVLERFVYIFYYMNVGL